MILRFWSYGSLTHTWNLKFKRDILGEIFNQLSETREECFLA